MIRKLKEESASITFAALGASETWRIVTYTGAAHGNVDGVGSVGGHIVLLVDQDGNCCPLMWKSNKIRRVVRSTLAAEALSMEERLEDSIYLRAMVGELVEKELVPMPVVVYIDKSVQEAILSTKMVDDKRLRLDIAAIKDSEG